MNGAVGSSPSAARSYVCVAPARVWPYLTAVAVIGGTLVAVAHVGRRAVELPGWRGVSALVLLVALAVAIAVVRLGADLQWRVRVEPDRLVFERGQRRRSLRLAQITQLGWEPAGSSRRALVSSVTIDDESGGEWRLPGMFDDGASLIDELVTACGRAQIATWCEALRLRPRMRRTASRVLLAYALLFAWLVAVLLFVGR